MKHYHTAALLIAFSTFSLSSMATIASNWTMLDNMEDPGFPAWTVTRILHDFGSLIQETDPLNKTNKVLSFYPRVGGISGLYLIGAALPLTTPIADGETGTIYLRYYEDDNIHGDIVFGFSDVEITPDGNGGFTAPIEGADFEGSIQRVSFDHSINVRDGDDYYGTKSKTELDHAIIAEKTWYDIWFVIYNRAGTDSDEYAIYIKGGIYTNPTLLQIAENTGTVEAPVYNYHDAANFRNGTSQSIQNVFILATKNCDCPASGSIAYIDNVAQALGVELTSGLPTDLCGWGYCPNENGDLNIGDWLGWINVNLEPWIYSYSFKSWMYMPEVSQFSNGAWVYVKK